MTHGLPEARLLRLLDLGALFVILHVAGVDVVIKEDLTRLGYPGDAIVFGIEVREIVLAEALDALCGKACLDAQLFELFGRQIAIGHRHDKRERCQKY